MSQFPEEIYTPREKENRPGVIYDPEKKRTIFVEDFNAVDDEIIAIETEINKIDDSGYLKTQTPGVGGSIPDINPPVLGQTFPDIAPPDFCGGNISISADNNYYSYYNTPIFYRAYSYKVINGQKYFSQAWQDITISGCGSFDVLLQINSLPAGADGIRIYRSVGYANYCSAWDFFDLQGSGYGIYDNSSGYFTQQGWPQGLPTLPQTVNGDLAFTLGTGCNAYWPPSFHMFFRIYSYKNVNGQKYFSSTYLDVNITTDQCYYQSLDLVVYSLPTGADGIAIFSYSDWDCPPGYRVVKYVEASALPAYYNLPNSIDWTLLINDPIGYPPSPSLPVAGIVAATPFNTIYFDPVLQKLVFKDSGGDIHALY
jgi:hypothetical protein